MSVIIKTMTKISGTNNRGETMTREEAIKHIENIVPYVGEKGIFEYGN